MTPDPAADRRTVAAIVRRIRHLPVDVLLLDTRQVLRERHILRPQIEGSDTYHALELVLVALLIVGHARQRLHKEDTHGA